MKNPDLNNPASKQPLYSRSPAIGFMFTYCVGMDLQAVLASESFSGFKAELSSDPDRGIFWPHIRDIERPRVVKTHYPFSFISDTALTKAKTVYTIRDPRDVCISYYNFSKAYKFDDFTGTFDQYVDAFLEGIVLFAPYWSHVNEAWDRRHNPNLHIIFYEKMKKNPREEITKLSKFLGANLSEDQIEKIIQYTSFMEMKQREKFIVTEEDKKILRAVGLDTPEDEIIFRKGLSGGWKNELTQEQKDKFEVWIKKNCPDMEIMNNFLNP
ncbi:Sulfotransferase domain [Trinorchestia longiramus]|nr:Sulfotransferase domain [Trinorchestia longiramus]